MLAAGRNHEPRPGEMGGLYILGLRLVRGSMGFTKVKVRISDPERRELAEDVELIVDTGAVYTIIPRETLERLGIRGRSRRRFYKVSKQAIERDVGIAVVEAMGSEAGTTVILGETGDMPLLGVTALGELGLEVDPVTRQIKPATLFLLRDIETTPAHLSAISTTTS